jgi:hypothetical protein
LGGFFSHAFLRQSCVSDFYLYNILHTFVTLSLSKGVIARVFHPKQSHHFTLSGFCHPEQLVSPQAR